MNRYIMASVKVAVRVRPINKRELDLNCAMIVSVEGNTTCIANTKMSSSLPSGNDSFVHERIRQFTFDYSYWSADPSDPRNCTQEKVFNELGTEVVEASFAGYNACVFAYGQTGSGKTYTMMGTPDNQGLVPRICESLFGRMSDSDTSYRTEISYLEIYNEHVRDLLRDQSQPQLNLRVREHPKEGPYVQELSKHAAVSYCDIDELLQLGNANRTTAATHMNDHSSRSHAIFTITFTQAKFNEDLPIEIHSKVHLVDLAGSERADAAGTSGQRLKEGGSINKSLVTLGNVISTLAELCSRSDALYRRSIFIPYRDSLLTWLLKDSLGGNSKTVMIATISPAECHYTETLSTLRYARRAKKIVNKPVINEDPNVKLIRELRAENARLRALLGDATTKPELTPMTTYVETTEQLTRNEEKVHELMEEWADKWQETTDILQEHKSLELRKEGSGIVLDSQLPYLFCIDDNVLRTGLVLYHLKEGDTVVGREDAAKLPDIVLVGRDIEAVHCIIHYEAGHVTLTPVAGALSYINNVHICEPTKLGQGAIIRLGSSHLFRFNDHGEAARLRQEMKDCKKSETLFKGKELQWTWSTISMTDSAVGSDIGDVEELEKLDEKRRLVEQLEVEHCLAEARRMAQLAVQETTLSDLKQTGDELRRLSSSTLEERESLNTSVEKQRMEARLHKEYLDSERRRLQQLSDRLEADKARARTERQLLRESSDVERARLETEHERQLMEWAELEKERRHQLTLRQNDSIAAQQRLDRVQKINDIKQKVWTDELADIRQVVDEELRAIRHTAAGLFPASAQNCASTLLPNYPCSERDTRQQADDAASDNSDFDIDSMKLKLDSDEDSVPELYLAHSPVLDGGQSLSWSPIDGEDNVAGLCRHLEEQVCALHTRVCDTLQRKYSSVLRCDDHTAQLSNDVIVQFALVRPVFEHLEKLTQSNDDHHIVAERLREFDRLLSTVDAFIQIHVALQSIDVEIRQRSFVKAVSSFETVQPLLQSLTVDRPLELAVVRVLQTELCVTRERLLYELGEAWSQIVMWTSPADGCHDRRQKTSSLTVSLSANQQSLLSQVVLAMSRVNMLPMRIRTLTEHIVSRFVEPVVCNHTSLVQTVVEADQAVIRINSIPSPATERIPVPPSEAFQKLQQILSFIHKMFAGITLHDIDREPMPLIQKIGKLISDPLFDLVYDNCILPAMPVCSGNPETLISFSSILADTEQFHAAVDKLGFLPKQSADGDEICGMQSLMYRLNNANAKFASVRAQELLHHAHHLMQQELLESVRVSTDLPIGDDVSCEGRSRELDIFVKSCREQAAGSGLKLPKCQISVAVCNLVCLSYETLREAVASTQEAAYHLCNAVHSMLELYADFTPSQHQDQISSLPLVAALHHNNCMFIAYHVIIIDKAFRQKLLPEGGSVTSSEEQEPRLAELVPKMRRIGNDSFSEYLETRTSQLHQLVTSANGFSCVADDNAAATMMVICALLHHFKHVSAIWCEVLPTNIYFRSVGSLLNASMSDVVDTVLTVEEFSVDDCRCLHSALEHLSTGAVDVFHVSSCSTSAEVTLHEVAPDWLRVRELSLLFAASLQEVDDRWSDGKGPLALYFAGDEVAKLVVAMFEKTGRRDALIAQLRQHRHKTCTV